MKFAFHSKAPPLRAEFPSKCTLVTLREHASLHYKYIAPPWLVAELPSNMESFTVVLDNLVVSPPPIVVELHPLTSTFSSVTLERCAMMPPEAFPDHSNIYVLVIV